MQRNPLDLLNLGADVLVLAGVATMGTGLWWIYPPAALIVIGAVLVYVGAKVGKAQKGGGG